jgi:hypothetical protein
MSICEAMLKGERRCSPMSICEAMLKATGVGASGASGGARQ